MIDVNELAQEIRRVDGNHDKGAGALAEALMPFLARPPLPSSQSLLSERDKRIAELEKSLSKINDIRNSIIGCQMINWSEHIYPLVAALNEAGIEGQGYPEAREYVGTLVERTNAAEARAEAAEALLKGVERTPTTWVVEFECYPEDEDGDDKASFMFANREEFETFFKAIAPRVTSIFERTCVTADDAIQHARSLLDKIGGNGE